MVGDTEDSILLANKLGISAIAVITGIRNRRLLLELNSKYIIDNIVKYRYSLWSKIEVHPTAISSEPLSYSDLCRYLISSQRF